MNEEGKNDSNVLAEDRTKLAGDRTDLAVQRTQLAHERTLMAWVRTSTSMISFGFTIYKFFQFDRAGQAPVAAGILSPRRFAIFMISIGFVSLLLAAIGYRRQTKHIRQATGQNYSLTEVVAYLVAVFGLAALIATILRA